MILHFSHITANYKSYYFQNYSSHCQKCDEGNNCFINIILVIYYFKLRECLFKTRVLSSIFRKFI